MSFELTVTRDHENRRLDKTLRSIWPRLGSGELMKAIRKGRVRVNGRKADWNYRLVRDDTIYVPWDPPSEDIPVKTKSSLDVVYRDRDCLFVNKPAGLLSQPSRKNEDSVVTRAWSFDKEQKDPFRTRPAVVNRLDRNTSGLIVIAMNGSALRELQYMFRENLLEKHYLALVAGRAPSGGIIDEPLLKDPKTNIVSVDKKGKPSKTRFKLLATNEDISLVDIELVTGRAHQARVHFAWAGLSLLGDMKYGDPELNGKWRNNGVKRPMLHSWSLKFPSVGGQLSRYSGQDYRAPLPEDFRKILALLGWESQLDN